VEFLQTLHKFAIVFGPLFLVQLFAAQTLWGIWLAVRPNTDLNAFRWFNRAIALYVGIISLSGIVLSLLGQKVPVATPNSKPNLSMSCNDAGDICQRLDPNRNWEHWMYGSFIILSLILAEWLVSGKHIPKSFGARLTAVVAFFALGAAFMAVRVAILPAPLK
jgi:hypothetical protein